MYCFGVDIGGTTVKLGLFKEDGALVEKWEIPTRTENGGCAILPDIAKTIHEKLQLHKIDKEQIIGIGVGIPAPITAEGIVQNTANLGWGYKDVKKELEELSTFPVRTGNDANVAALGEMWKGGGAGHQNMIMVTLGTGVGGGIIVEGKILTGAGGAGGEIGHLRVNDEETETCGCGNRGCLEQYASATGIARIAKKKLEKYNGDTILNASMVTAKEVFDAVKKGDLLAIEIAKEFGGYLGHALAMVSVFADPSIYVIGGGVSKAGEILFDYITDPYMESALFANKGVKFALAKLGNDAGIYGAAKLVLS